MEMMMLLMMLMMLMMMMMTEPERLNPVKNKFQVMIRAELPEFVNGKAIESRKE
jgi:hypothetical protein